MRNVMRNKSKLTPLVLIDAGADNNVVFCGVESKTLLMGAA